VLQLKQKHPKIQGVKIIRSLIEDRGNNQRGYNSPWGLESRDVLVLLIAPIPLWPLYFRYKKNHKKVMGAKELRKKILANYTWIKGVIDSAETQSHIKCCRRLVENWATSTGELLGACRCQFYRGAEIKKTIECYKRSQKELSRHLAEKQVNLAGEKT
jgi:hypothetical protein